MEHSDVVQWEQRISYKTHSNTSTADAAVVHVCVCGLINAASLTSLPVAKTKERRDENYSRAHSTLGYPMSTSKQPKFSAAYCYDTLKSY